MWPIQELIRDLIAIGGGLSIFLGGDECLIQVEKQEFFIALGRLAEINRFLEDLFLWNRLQFLEGINGTKVEAMYVLFTFFLANRAKNILLN